MSLAREDHTTTPRWRARARIVGEAALTKSHEMPTEPPIVNNCRVRDADGGEVRVRVRVSGLGLADPNPNPP